MKYFALATVLFLSASLFAQTEFEIFQNIHRAMGKRDWPLLEGIIKAKKHMIDTTQPEFLESEIMMYYFSGREELAIRRAEAFVYDKFQNWKYRSLDDLPPFVSQTPIVCLLISHYLSSAKYLEAYRCTKILEEYLNKNNLFFERGYLGTQKHIIGLAHFCKSLVGDEESSSYILGALLSDALSLDREYGVDKSDNNGWPFNLLIDRLEGAFRTSGMNPYSSFEIDIMGIIAERYGLADETKRRLLLEEIEKGVTSCICPSNIPNPKGWCFEFRGTRHLNHCGYRDPGDAMEIIKNTVFGKKYLTD